MKKTLQILWLIVKKAIFALSLIYWCYALLLSTSKTIASLIAQPEAVPYKLEFSLMGVVGILISLGFIKMSIDGLRGPKSYKNRMKQIINKNCKFEQIK